MDGDPVLDGDSVDNVDRDDDDDDDGVVGGPTVDAYVDLAKTAC